jgi:hypothetical protein
MRCPLPEALPSGCIKRISLDLDHLNKMTMTRSLPLLLLLLLSVTGRSVAQECEAGIFNIPLVQCVEYGNSFIYSIYPGSESSPTGSELRVLVFEPVVGASSGGNNGEGFAIAIFDDYELTLNNDLNGVLSSNGLSPMMGEWHLYNGFGFSGEIVCIGDDFIKLTFVPQGVQCSNTLWVRVDVDVNIDEQIACGVTATPVVYFGTPPYQYAYSSGQTGPVANATDLCSGVHLLTVTDALGATAVDTFNVLNIADIFSAFDTLFPQWAGLDTIFSVPVENCDFDYTLSVDSFQVTSVFTVATDTLIATWVVWQQGEPYTLTGFYQGTDDIDAILELTIFCEDGRSSMGRYRLFARPGDDLLGVSDAMARSRLTVFPNPTDGRISMDLTDEMGAVDLMISDLNGKVLMRAAGITGRNATIDLSALPTGIYVVRAVSKTGILISKVVKL